MFRINPDGTRQPIQGLLLADTVLPDELEDSASETTPARELFDLMREACLGKLTNTMIKTDGTTIPINGAAYNVALRMQNSPKAAEIVTALIHQFPWMKNQHTKRLVRSAVQILKASRQQAPTEQQPAPADSDIALTVSTVEAADSDTWASVLAVDEHDQIIATISNGSVFHPHAVSPEKAMKDTQVKSGAEAMQRFADQLADPAPAMTAKLRLIQETALAGHQVRLIVHRALRKQADLVADAVRNLPRRTPAPIATKESGVALAQLCRLAPIYKVRVGIDTPLLDEVDENELPYPGQGRLRWVCGTNVATIGILVGSDVYYYTRNKGKVIIAKTPENSREITVTDDQGVSHTQPMTRRVFLGRKVYDKKEQAMMWRKSYYLARELWESSPVFQSMLRLLSEVKKQQDEERSGWEYETFRHRTRHAGRMNGLHDEETNMRFDQHDDQIFRVSPLEELEQTLALHGADRSTIDLTLADNTIDAGVAHFLSQQIDDGVRRRSAGSYNADKNNDPTRPVWWMNNVFDTRKLARADGSVLAPTTGALISIETSAKHGLTVKVRPPGKPTITYTHLVSVNSDVERFRTIKTGDLLGWTDRPTILDTETVAETTQVKDCRIKRFDAAGNLVEGWVIPANYQEASKYYGTQLLKRIKVADRGRILSRQEQKTINGGDYWAFPNIAGEPTDKPDSFWTTWPQLPALRKLEPAAPTTWPQPKPQPKPQPRHLTDVWVRWWISEHPTRKHHNPSVAALLRQQANTAFARKQNTPPTAKEKREAKAAAATQRKAQMYKKPAGPRPFTQRSFTPPPSPTWHEPLTDDDKSHVIVTLNDSEHALAKLVANLIV
jgi:hypothetical protein